MSKVYITRLKWNKQQYKTVKLSIMQYSKRIKPPPSKIKIENNLNEFTILQPDGVAL